MVYILMSSKSEQFIKFTKIKSNIESFEKLKVLMILKHHREDQ